MRIASAEQESGRNDDDAKKRKKREFCAHCARLNGKKIDWRATESGSSSKLSVASKQQVSERVEVNKANASFSLDKQCND